MPEERVRIAQLGRESRKLRQAGGILRNAGAHPADRSAIACLADKDSTANGKGSYRGEPIGKVTLITAAARYSDAVRQADPVQGPTGLRRDETLSIDMRPVWEKCFQVRVARKV